MRIGEIVEYVLPSGPNAGQVRPAIVNGVTNDNEVSLYVFAQPTDGAAFQGNNAARTGVAKDSRGTGGTWREVRI